MLKVNNISVEYGKAILAVSNVSLGVPEADVVSLLGSNGAGKSTILKAISGLLRAEGGAITAGNIEFDGEKIDKKEMGEIVKMGIVQVMEGRRIFENLSVQENLIAGTAVHGASDLKGELEIVYGYFNQLKKLSKQRAGYLSGGEQQMLVVGRALMAHSRLMLLDEPSLGLSPLLVQNIFEILKRINQEEKTSILVVEQNAMVALEIASYGYILENGSVAVKGSAKELRKDANIREFYLGLDQIGEKKGYK